MKLKELLKRSFGEAALDRVQHTTELDRRLVSPFQEKDRDLSLPWK